MPNHPICNSQRIYRSISIQITSCAVAIMDGSRRGVEGTRSSLVKKNQPYRREGMNEDLDRWILMKGSHSFHFDYLSI